MSRHLLGTPPRSLVRRVQNRLGLAAGALPPRCYLRSLRQTLLAARLDAVLCHYGWNAMMVQAALDGALPVIHHAHGRDVTSHLRNLPYRKSLARMASRFAHRVVVGSYQAKICPISRRVRHAA